VNEGRGCPGICLLAHPPTTLFPSASSVIEEVIEPEPVKAAPEQWRRIGEEI